MLQGPHQAHCRVSSWTSSIQSPAVDTHTYLLHPEVVFHLRLGAIHLGHSFEVDVEEGNRANGGTVAVLGQGATKVRGQLRKNLSKAGGGRKNTTHTQESNDAFKADMGLRTSNMC
jgi:hypothetical protein